MVFSKLSAIAGVLSLAASVAAHGHVKGITVDGTFVRGFELADAYSQTPPETIGWATTALDNGFVEPAKFGTSDIACHLGGKAAKLFTTVAAGSKISVEWDTWPESHKGPVLDYLAPFADSAADLKFFKFAEEGLVNGKWAADKINAANGFKWEVTIPADIAPGKYVYRHEIIALHGSPQANGAQNYPQCLNIEITGSGTAKPAGVSATTFYTPTDPGILVANFYNGLTDYKIPGPAVYSSSGSAPAPAPVPSPSTTTGPSATAEPSFTSIPSPTQPSEEYPSEPTGSAPSPTSAPIETSAPSPSPTSSKSKSACKPKTKTSALPTAAPTPVAVEPSLPTSPVVPTPVEPTPEQPGSTPVPETPTSDLPAGTKLSSVLSWLSKFYAAHGEEFDAETPLRRRHARQF